MGDWKDLGEDLVDSYMGTEEDIQELAVIIKDRLGCRRCKAQELCREYKDECFDGECWKVLDSFFSDTEDEDTREERERREEEAEIQEREDWHSWTYRD